MKIIIESEINRYYLQTLCMIFFPGAKFSEQEEITEQTPIVRFASSETENGIDAEAEIRIGERKCRRQHFEPYQAAYTKEKTLQIAIGAAFFRAGEIFFSCTPPWGILTGIHPAKTAAEILMGNRTIFETQEILTEKYLVNPKKALLATEIAHREAELIRPFDHQTTCSLYISIPFCPTRCSYCSFVSYTTPRLLSLIPAYLERLCKDIDRIFQTIQELHLKVATIYIGGGTPTTLQADQLERLLRKIHANIDVSTLHEFTVEGGRPDTITVEKLKIMKEYGVTRVSINTQTLNDKILENIGRKHTAKDFYRAFEMAKKSGISSINTDLIAGLPEESFVSFSNSVDEVIKLHPDNVTIHTFCVKKAADILREGTEIYSRTGGDTGKSVDYAQISAKNAGYFPYYMYKQKNTVGNFENVGFSFPNAECLYNVFMMEDIHTVFAVGAGAVTKLVQKNVPYNGKNRIQRIFSPKYPYEYLEEENDASWIKTFHDPILKFYTE